MEQGKPYVRRSPYAWLDRPFVRPVLAVQCLCAFVAQIYLAIGTMARYAVDIPGALTTAFWLLSAGFSIVALAGLVGHREWFAPPLLIAESMIALSALYVIWADLSSAYVNDIRVWVPSIGLLLVALPVIPPLAVRLTQLPGKAWAGGLALLSTLGLTQFTLENVVLPNRSAPSLEISATLEEMGTSEEVTHVRGVITFTNVGRAPIWLPQALATVEASTGRTGPTARLNAQQVASTFDPMWADGRVFARPLPGHAARGVIWMEDLVSFNSFLPPGLTDRREFVVDVPRTRVRHLELDVAVTALTNAQWKSATTCDQRTTALEQEFLDRVRKVTVRDRWTFSCLEVPLVSRNFVRAHTDDGPSMVMGYSFAGPRPEFLGPFSYYRSDEEAFADPENLNRAADRFSRQTPSLIMMTTAVLTVPITAASPDESSAPPDGGP